MQGDRMILSYDDDRITAIRIVGQAIIKKLRVIRSSWGATAG